MQPRNGCSVVPLSAFSVHQNLFLILKKLSAPEGTPQSWIIWIPSFHDKNPPNSFFLWALYVPKLYEKCPVLLFTNEARLPPNPQHMADLSQSSVLLQKLSFGQVWSPLSWALARDRENCVLRSTAKQGIGTILLVREAQMLLVGWY